MRRPAAELPQVEVKSRQEWRDWLAENHTISGSIWLVTYKKSSPFYLPYDELVEEALCFGWVDGLTRGLDEERSMLLLSPRKPGSGWSRPNKERIARLESLGLMSPAGVAAVERAKADGTWSMLDGVENLEEPGDLANALDSLSAARANWDAFPRSIKRGLLEWLLQAKKPETRSRRILEIVESASQNIRGGPFRPKT